MKKYWVVAAFLVGACAGSPVAPTEQHITVAMEHVAPPPPVAQPQSACMGTDLMQEQLVRWQRELLDAEGNGPGQARTDELVDLSLEVGERLRVLDNTKFLAAMKDILPACAI